MIEILHADCRMAIDLIPDSSIDSIVTDPPYALVSISSRYGKEGSAPPKHGSDGLYARAARGFMGKQWDTGETAFATEFWAECLRVLKPGGHVVAFSGTRTYHRLAVALEDAGFEIRDQLAWVYGTGFPKSHNAGDGWGTALKPAWEPIVFARKPLIGTVAANVLAHGTGAINIDGCRVAFASGADEAESKTKNQHADFGSGAMTNQVYGKYDKDRENYNPPGRWPANLIHDGSDEVVGLFPNTTSGKPCGVKAGNNNNVFGQFAGGIPVTGFGDSGSAARFFYSAKASKADRAGSKHPTVKPVALMRWLCKLVTPPGGTVLDPFAGSGTTGAAAEAEGFNAILIEREAEYVTDIKKRMGVEPTAAEVEDMFS